MQQRRIAQKLEVEVGDFFNDEAPEITEVKVEMTQPSELRVRFPQEVALDEYELRNLQKRFATEFDIIRERQGRGPDETSEGDEN